MKPASATCYLVLKEHSSFDVFCEVILQSLVFPFGLLTVNGEVSVGFGKGAIPSDGLGQLLQTKDPACQQMCASSSLA